MGRRYIGFAFLIACAGCGGDDSSPAMDAPCATAVEIEGLRLNQIQAVGSHNSYRRKTYGPIFDSSSRSRRRFPRA